MNHQTDTPSFISVPNHTRLFRRDGGTYYLRAKVPKKIRHIICKSEIRISLRTKDLKEARQKVKFESLRVDATFAKAEKNSVSRALAVSILSDEEIDWLVRKYFVKLEQEARRMVESVTDPYQRENTSTVISENLVVENMVLHQTGGYRGSDMHWIVDNFLAEETPHLNVPEGSQTYHSLFPALNGPFPKIN